MTSWNRLALMVAFALGGVPAWAAPCAGFADVEDTSAFCPSVEWLKNRAITTGCMPNQFCPEDGATRLQIAAFLERFGNVMRPVTLTDYDVWAVTDSGNELCNFGPQPSAAFPRSAKVTGRVEFFGYAAGGYVVRPVLHLTPPPGFDDMSAVVHVQLAPYVGTTGNPWSSTPPTHFGQAVVFSREMSIPANAVPAFGLHFEPDGATPGPTDFYRCYIRIEMQAM